MYIYIIYYVLCILYIYIYILYIIYYICRVYTSELNLCKKGEIIQRNPTHFPTSLDPGHYFQGNICMAFLT